jgi:hypothetical protein
VRYKIQIGGGGTVAKKESGGKNRLKPKNKFEVITIVAGIERNINVKDNKPIIILNYLWFIGGSLDVGEKNSM